MVGYPKLAQSDETNINNQSATDILKDAYNNRYVWNKDFPGYTANVSATYNNQEDKGSIEVKSSIKKLKVKNVENSEIADLIRGQIMMEVNHRQSIPYEQLHGQNTLVIKNIESTTASIEEKGKDGALYKIKDRVILQVDRSMPNNMTVTVDTLETNKTSDGYLASEYLSTLKNINTNELIQEAYSIDDHEKVGNFYLLNSRRIYLSKVPDKNSQADISIKFDNFKLGVDF
ncbi:MAG: DUF3386 family protein [Hydrococcus sp. SU_1_0]|nr:DUF3386 family protein [Hydrococcus sp. SU_1_0]